MEDIQSWWEVPSIAHFSSLFRSAFGLLDIDIEDLEGSLLFDNDEDDISVVQLLLIRLLKGCLRVADVNENNYDYVLREYLMKKWMKEGKKGEYDLMNTPFKFLTPRTKVKILHSLCDDRLCGEDVNDLLRNLESDTLRVQPLGKDASGNTYWYFYGTRLYKEEPRKNTKKSKKTKENMKNKNSKTDSTNMNGATRRNNNRNTSFIDDENENGSKTSWNVVCSTENDWKELAQKFKKSRNAVERELYERITNDFLPEIGQLIIEREKNSRKKLLDLLPRRASQRIEQIKKKEKPEDHKVISGQKRLNAKEEAKQDRQEAERRQFEVQERERRALERMISREDRAIREQFPDLLSDRHGNLYFNNDS